MQNGFMIEIPQIRNYEVESQQILNFQWYGETLIGFR